jgi:ankyrin repeat protein
LDINNIDIAKLQAYMLVQQNDEGKNVLHLAGANGDLELCQFIIDRAGANNLNILSFIVRTLDNMFRTPLYVLCVKGYEKNFDPVE